MSFLSSCSCILRGPNDVTTCFCWRGTVTVFASLASAFLRFTLGRAAVRLSSEGRRFYTGWLGPLIEGVVVRRWGDVILLAVKCSSSFMSLSGSLAVDCFSSPAACLHPVFSPSICSFRIMSAYVRRMLSAYKRAAHLLRGCLLPNSVFVFASTWNYSQLALRRDSFQHQSFCGKVTVRCYI